MKEKAPEIGVIGAKSKVMKKTPTANATGIEF